MSDDRLRAKAQRALEAARRAHDAGDPETTADRAYYAAFYAAWALLDRHGLPRPKTHHGLISEFSRHFVRHGPLSAAHGATLSRLESLRLAADYMLEPVPLKDAWRALNDAESFLDDLAALDSSAPSD